MASPRVCVVAGVGRGIGRSLALRFARGGYTVALMARNRTYRGADKLTPVVQELTSLGLQATAVVCDLADPASVRAAFARVRDELGEVSVLCYNAGARQMRGIDVVDTTDEMFLDYWKVNCMGAFLCAKEVLPGMLRAGHGTVLFTGATAALRGSAGLCHFSPGKAGLRMLAQTLAKEVGPRGVHVAHVVIDGAVDLPIVRKTLQAAMQSGDETIAARARKVTLMSPDEIAAQYWHLHTQPSTVWTLELDLRPNNEPITSAL